MRGALSRSALARSVLSLPRGPHLLALTLSLSKGEPRRHPPL